MSTSDSIIPPGYCQCGCGKRTPLSTHTWASRGWKRGEPAPFLRGHKKRNSLSLDEQLRRYTVNQQTDCWEWTGPINNWGYGYFHANNGTCLAHRVAYEQAHGPLPKGAMVCHSCDNRPCINPVHLFAGTFNDNMDDMVRKARQCIGERQASSKLTDLAVLDIRRRYRAGATQRSLAVEYGVSPSSIGSVVRRRRWKHVREEGDDT
jgi:hypothetical protein